MSDVKITGKYSKQSLPLIALAMLSGVCVLQLQADLQAPLWTRSELLILLPVCLWLFYRIPQKRIVFACALGYLWALLFAQLYLHHQLEDEYTGQDILLEGIVRGVPDVSDSSVRFNFEITQYLSINGVTKDSATPNFKFPKPSRLRLSWYYSQQAVHSGERWRLLVRLKQPHGMQNPGGFDYEKWLYQQSVHATGYVRKKQTKSKD